eukprot:5905618-Prymnesium_polylepis.1
MKARVEFQSLGDAPAAGSARDEGSAAEAVSGSEQSDLSQLISRLDAQDARSMLIETMVRDIAQSLAGVRTQLEKVEAAQTTHPRAVLVARPSPPAASIQA